jgi:thiosulfate reductase cytochrome b subunit
VPTGLSYVFSGILTRHFRRDFLDYERAQRIACLGAVFILLPLTIWTGFAMSPAIGSVFPALVAIFGGQQSARTLHFIAAALLVLFFLVHVAMIWRAGFGTRVGAMITGHAPAGISHAANLSPPEWWPPELPAWQSPLVWQIDTV